jgi:hypothetical protein
MYFIHQPNVRANGGECFGDVFNMLTSGVCLCYVWVIYIAQLFYSVRNAQTE